MALRKRSQQQQQPHQHQHQHQQQRKKASKQKQVKLPVVVGQSHAVVEEEDINRSWLRRAILRFPFKPVLQRLPGAILLLLIPFAILGPVYTPILFSLHLFSLHILFLIANIRVCFGVYKAFHAAKAHSRTNWYEMYLAHHIAAAAKTDLLLSAPSSSSSLSASSSSSSSSSHQTTTNTFAMVEAAEELISFDSVMHVVLVPNYKEEMDTLCETLDVLASHVSAKTNYKICLAMEESEAKAVEKAITLLSMYSTSFFEITYTIHPKNLEGEIRGKSSNVAWAASQMSLRTSPEARKREILTIIDADTCFAQDYFDSVTYYYTTATPAERNIMMFAPSTVFDRNAKNVPVFVRVNDMLWSIGVLSNLYESSLVKFPCSAYSVSMNLAVSVNFWDAGPEAIGEDMHMYLKCFFSTRGNVIVKSIFSPASCCNVEGEGTGISGYISAMSARYTQGTRHLWGSLDTGYFIRRTLFSFLTPEKEFLKSPSTSGQEHSFSASSPFKLYPLITLAHRLMEAHLIMGQFVLLTIMAWFLIPNEKVLYAPLANFFWSVMSPNGEVHPFLDAMLYACVYLRLAVTIPNIVTFYYYEKYHQWVGFDRWALQDTSSMMCGHSRADSGITLSSFGDNSSSVMLNAMSRRSSGSVGGSTLGDDSSDESASDSEGSLVLEINSKTSIEIATSSSSSTSDVVAQFHQQQHQKKLQQQQTPKENRVQYLGKRPVLAAPREYPAHIFDWAAIPFAGFMFLVVPQFHAQLMHLYTERLEYKVAAKPTLNRRQSLSAVGIVQFRQ